MADATWETIVEHLVEASDEEVSAEEVKHETSLREDLQAITLVMDLEEHLGVAVEDEELEQLETVGDLHDLIESKLEAVAAEDSV